MSPAAPRVSVCIPAYNAAPYIERCVRSALAEDLDGLELIAVDDESSDGTGDLLADLLEGEPRARLLRNPARLGLAANWARVISEASGELVKLLCSDDYVLPGGLAAQVAALEVEPGAVLVSGRRRVIDGEDRTLLPAVGWKRRGLIPGREAVRRLVRSGGNPVGEPSAVLLRREPFVAAGGFDAAWRYLIDVSGYVRVLERGDLVVLDNVVAAFRAWPESLSARLAAKQVAETVAFYKSLLARGVPGITRVDVAVGTAAARARHSVRAVVRRRARQ